VISDVEYLIVLEAGRYSPEVKCKTGKFLPIEVGSQWFSKLDRIKLRNLPFAGAAQVHVLVQTSKDPGGHQ
jgi:hypothetical protein